MLRYSTRYDRRTYRISLGFESKDANFRRHPSRVDPRKSKTNRYAMWQSRRHPRAVNRASPSGSLFCSLVSREYDFHFERFIFTPAVRFRQDGAKMILFSFLGVPEILDSIFKSLSLSLFLFINLEKVISLFYP